MSSTTQQRTYTCSLEGCSGTYPGGQSFCSQRCYAIDEGRSVLNRLEEDAQFCATCFRPQYHAGLREDGGVFYVDGPAAQRYTDDTTGHPYPRRTYRPTRGCACGTVDPTDTVAELTSTSFAQGNRLWRALVSLAAKGAIDAEPDPLAFADAMREPGWTWAYAAGMAVIQE